MMRERALELVDRMEGGLRYAAPMLCAMCLAEKRGELANPCRAVPTCLSRERNHAKALAATESLRALLAASPPALRPEEAERLAAIRAREKAATREPWESPLRDLGAVESFKAVDFYFDQSYEAYPPYGESGPVFVASTRENAEFLTHARADVPWLLALVARLAGEGGER